MVRCVQQARDPFFAFGIGVREGDPGYLDVTEGEEGDDDDADQEEDEGVYDKMQVSSFAPREVSERAAPAAHHTRYLLKANASTGANFRTVPNHSHWKCFLTK